MDFYFYSTTIFRKRYDVSVRPPEGEELLVVMMTGGSDYGVENITSCWNMKVDAS